MSTNVHQLFQDMQTLLDRLNTLEPHKYAIMLRQATSTREKHYASQEAASATRGRELRDHSNAEAHRLCSEISDLENKIRDALYVFMKAESLEQLQDWKKILLEASQITQLETRGLLPIRRRFKIIHFQTTGRHGYTLSAGI